MPVAIRRAPGPRWLGVLAALGLCAGCQPSTPLSKAGVALAPPSDWRPVGRETWPVPGTPLAAWSGPEGSSLVVYQSLPTPDTSAEGLARGIATRMENLPGVTVKERRTTLAAGFPAARVELTAPGTGDALAPSGTGIPLGPPGRAVVPTRRVLIVIPRRGDTLGLVWHFPDDLPRKDRRVEDVLTTLRLADPPAFRPGY